MTQAAGMGLTAVQEFNSLATLPLTIAPSASCSDPTHSLSLIRSSREVLDEHLIRHGALLFQGFHVDTVGEFERFTAACTDHVMDYVERSSPRSQVANKVYTSTDYPSSQKIFAHNEHSYSVTYPRKLFFCCLTPAAKGGETPLIDIRKVTQRIPGDVKERFRAKKWMYVRNFGDGLGLSWQSSFQTADRSSVESYCRHHKIEFEWKPGNRLRTRQIRPAFVNHPLTGESLWFNHATFFNISTLDSTMRRVLADEFAEDELPNNTYYGDGSPIEASILDELRLAYESEMVTFQWLKGDVVMIDNVLTAHARNAFTGARQVLFAMAEPVVRTDI